MPVDEGSLFALYCNLKPFVACAILRLVEEGQVSLDDAVGRVLPGPMSDVVREVTLFDLLAHRSGLQCFGAVGIRALAPSLRWDFISQLDANPAGKVAAFADAEPWFILGRVLEHVYGSSYDQAVAALVLRPYGIEGAVLGTSPPNFDQVALSGVIDAGTEIAAVSELSPSVATEWNPAFSGYMRALDMHRLMIGLSADRAGAGQVLGTDMMRLATSSIATAAPDGVFHRAATFGLGFLVNGKDRWLDDRLSPDAFGHVNQGGRGFLIVDPRPTGDHLAVTGLFLDSLNDPVEVVQRRRQLMHRICDDLDW